MPHERITDAKLIEELGNSRNALADPDSDDPLVQWLWARYPERCEPAFVLHWIREQAEDIYQVLLADETLVTVEVSRRSGMATELELDEATHDLYHVRRRKPGRSWRRKFEMALKLLNAAKDAQR